MSAGREELVARLKSDQAGVRRVAVHDLIALGATEVLTEHLGAERDEKAALLIIRYLGRAGAPGAMPVLLGLYEDRQTPVRIALAAIVAHDTALARGGAA